MSVKVHLTIAVGAILIAECFSAELVPAQNASATSLADQLKAQYKLAKIVPDSNGYRVAEPGTMLVIQKAGIVGVPLGNNSVDPVIFAIEKDSDLHHSATAANTWKFELGHDVYLSKLDIDAKHQKVLLTIVECDSSNPVKSSFYKSVVDFEFPNGYLAGAEVGQIEDVISQVLTIDNGTTGGQQQVHGGQSTSAGLTNDDIIKLAQAKLPDSVVVSKIKSSSCDFDTSPDALIKLEKAGVSDMVLQAILDTQAQSNPSDSGENSLAATSGKESDAAQTTTFSGLYDSLFSQAQLQFNPDGSFSQHGPGSWQNSGHFTVNGDTLTLTYPSTGRSSIFRIQGDKIYNGTGKPVWVRQGDPPASTAQPNEPSGPACGNFDACMKIAQTLLESAQSDRALARFQEASQLDQSKGDAWVGMGRAYFQMGQYDDAGSMFDKALQLGSTLTIGVCHAKALCGDTGTFLLSAKEVSFVNKKGEKEFAAAPSAVTSEGAGVFNNGQAYYLQLRFAGKNYRFYYLPRGAQCSLGFVCQEPGPSQQQIFANYVHERLVRIAAGDFSSQPTKP